MWKQFSPCPNQRPGIQWNVLRASYISQYILKPSKRLDSIVQEHNMRDAPLALMLLSGSHESCSGPQPSQRTRNSVFPLAVMRSWGRTRQNSQW